MKVFAEYVKENGIEYRKRTLIQFGASWDLIGSAVLKNPGSATPQRKVNIEECEQLNKFYNTKVDESIWHFFDIGRDNTIRTFLPNLFNGYYATGVEKVKLEGVIQLFNLFYVRNANVNKAKDKIENNDSEFLYEDSDELISLLRDKPVYLGWGDVCNTNSNTKELATKIFEFQKSSGIKYLNEGFSDNKFYHPQYLNMGNDKDTVHSFWRVIESKQQ